MLSFYFCIGCKYCFSKSHYDKNGLANGGELWCEWDKNNPDNKCEIQNNRSIAWGTKFEYKDK